MRLQGRSANVHRQMKTDVHVQYPLKKSAGARCHMEWQVLHEADGLIHMYSYAC